MLHLEQNEGFLYLIETLEIVHFNQVSRERVCVCASVQINKSA